MIAIEVFHGEELVYRTSSARLIHGRLKITRLDERDPQRISPLGPHFSIFFPDSSHPELGRLSGSFISQGENALGSVSFLIGYPALQDGSETYSIGQLNGKWGYTEEDGFAAKLDVTLGDPHTETLWGTAPRHSRKRYSISIAVPFSRHMQFWGIREPSSREFCRNYLARVFGQAVADRTEQDD